MINNKSESEMETISNLTSKPLQEEISLKDKIYELYNQEFEEKIVNILNEKESEFISKFQNRMKIIIEDLYENSDSIYERDKFLNIKREVEKYFYEDVYKKTVINLNNEWVDYEKKIFSIKKKSKYPQIAITNYKNVSSSASKSTSTANKSGILYLTNFRKHCKHNDNPIHKCKSEFLSITIDLTKGGDKANASSASKPSHVICVGCKCVYTAESIKMYCDKCQVEFFSSYLFPFNKNYQPATWEKYHCGALINDQMHCIKCRELFYLDLNEDNLICLKCDFSVAPLDISWQCILCKSEFRTNAKIYNPNEFKKIKLAIRNTILNKVLAKPSLVPCCKTKVDIKKIDFFHKIECRGIIYLGKIGDSDNDKKIIVCSQCKMMTSYDKFCWTCPLCLNKFNQSEIPRSITPTTNLIVDRNKGLDRGRVEIFPISRSSNEQCLKEVRVKKPSISLVKNNFYRLNTCENEEPVNKYTKNRIMSISKNISAGGIPSQNQNQTKKLIYKKPEANANLNISLGNSTDFTNYLNNYKISTPRNKFLEENQNKNNNSEFRLSDTKFRASASNILKSVDGLAGLKFTEKEELGGSRFRQMSRAKNQVEENFLKNDNYFNYKSNLNLNSSPNTQKISNPSGLLKINIEDYTIISQIGEGSFGKIYLVEDKFKNPFSLKKIIADDEVELDMFESEYELVNNLKHKHIMNIIGMTRRRLEQTTYALYILMEVGITDWEREIKLRAKQNRFYTEKELLNILKQLVSGLAFLQRKAISHRDIKPQNILIFRNEVFKIADFGEAKQISKRATSDKLLSTLRGTELYMSPLLFNALHTNQSDIKHNSFKSDVYSLAYCLLYAASLNVKVLYDFRKIYEKSTMIQMLNKHFRFLSEKFFNLLSTMLEINESNRLDFIELEKILIDL